MDLPKNHFLAMFEAQGSKFSRTMGAEDCSHPFKLGTKDLVACYDETLGRYQGTARAFSEVVNEMMLMNDDDAPEELGFKLGLSLKFEGGGLKSARKVGEPLYYVFPDDAALSGTSVLTSGMRGSFGCSRSTQRPRTSRTASPLVACPSSRPRAGR